MWNYWGRVEVKVDQEWGTVCDDGFDIDDANVFCRYLGFHKATGVYSRAVLGEGSGPIILTKLKCKGDENSPFDCKHNGFEKTKGCTHKNDVVIFRNNGSFSSFSKCIGTILHQRIKIIWHSLHFCVRTFPEIVCKSWRKNSHNHIVSITYLGCED